MCHTYTCEWPDGMKPSMISYSGNTIFFRGISILYIGKGVLTCELRGVTTAVLCLTKSSMFIMQFIVQGMKSSLKKMKFIQWHAW